MISGPLISSASRTRGLPLAPAWGGRIRSVWSVVWLAAVLLLAQGLGQWHRVAHAGAERPSVVAPSEPSGHELFSHAAGHADCQLLDHLLLEGGLLAALPAFAAALSAEAVPTGRALSAPALVLRRAYLARAPPLRG